VLERNHFDLIHHFAGTWNGGADPDFQDVLILERRAEPMAGGPEHAAKMVEG